MAIGERGKDAPAGGGAYVAWLQSALHEQSTLMKEKDRALEDMHQRLAEATALIAAVCSCVCVLCVFISHS